MMYILGKQNIVVIGQQRIIINMCHASIVPFIYSRDEDSSDYEIAVEAKGSLFSVDEKNKLHIRKQTWDNWT